MAATYVEDAKPINQSVDVVILELVDSHSILDTMLVSLRNVGLTEQDFRMVGLSCDDGK